MKRQRDVNSEESLKKLNIAVLGSKTAIFKAQNPCFQAIFLENLLQINKIILSGYIKSLKIH